MNNYGYSANNLVMGSCFVIHLNQLDARCWPIVPVQDFVIWVTKNAA